MATCGGMYFQEMYFQEYGGGDPVIALHPLALESTAFAGVGRSLAKRGLRTLAVDLPGFGRTPAPDRPLTPAVLAAPVIDLARRLHDAGERAPLLLGMSLGGRVALEAAFTEPELFRGVTLVAPYLPWRGHRWLLGAARMMNPDVAERVPLERIWPILKRISGVIESRRGLEQDWLARASVRVVYYWSCSATRRAFLSAARELALDPARGPDGTWTRLRHLELPTAFLWCGKDALIPAGHAAHVADVMPAAQQLELACSGHFVHGAHYRCFDQAVARAVGVVDAQAARPGRRRSSAPPARIDCACLADEAGRRQRAAGSRAVLP